MSGVTIKVGALLLDVALPLNLRSGALSNVRLVGIPKLVHFPFAS